MMAMMIRRAEAKRREGVAKKRAKVKKRHREAALRRNMVEAWTVPTIADVYAQVLVAQTMLMRIPDIELAPVKHEMGVLEDLVWQFCH